MKIDAVDIHRVDMPLVRPFRTAFGDDTSIESVLVRMRSGDAVGWGEAAPGAAPAYCGESAAGVVLTIARFLAPRLLGEGVTTGADLQERLRPIKGNRFAKAALDHAWWDLHARQAGRPLWQVLGGRGDTVDVGADFGVMDSIDELLETIAGAVEAGFKRVKLKYRPGWDLPMIEAVRGAFPDLTVHVDCNSAYTLDDLPMLRRLDEFGLSMIEQPLAHDDLLDHAALQREIRTPICLDESIVSPAKARQAIEIGACRWVNIKPGRVGGLTEAVAVHDLCRDAGVPCWVGGMLESAVGANHCLALATLDNVKYPSDVFPSDRFYCPDLSDPPVVLSGPSRATALPAPGCGAAPDPSRLAAQALDCVRLPA